MRLRTRMSSLRYQAPGLIFFRLWDVIWDSSLFSLSSLLLWVVVCSQETASIHTLGCNQPLSSAGNWRKRNDYPIQVLLQQSEAAVVVFPSRYPLNSIEIYPHSSHALFCMLVLRFSTAIWSSTVRISLIPSRDSIGWLPQTDRWFDGLTKATPSPTHLMLTHARR